MKFAEKIKSIAVQCNPPRYSRRELLDGTNAGLELKYQIGVKGVGRSLKESAEDGRRYAKGFARMKGWCFTCEHFDAKIKIVGKHCKLKEQENCMR